ncbi:MAG TPA: YihY/virulence factor BrkB family protein [Opitutaceae bacterium]|jgi:membrane protein|nr:YihY/virulence factor BrkB family protein [Opitutaceae bacterium]
MAGPAHRWNSFVQIFRKEIWQPAHLTDRSPRGRLYAALRVISITGSGLLENKAASRAAALSFSSLLGLGPLVAIAVLVAGFMLNKNDPNLAVDTLHKLISFVAPSISEYEKMSADGKTPPLPEAKNDIVSAGTPKLPPAPGAGAAPSTAPDTDSPGPSHSGAVAVNQDLVHLINGFIAGSRSGTAGVIGALTLILIVLQLFTSIENAFNEIWGVRRGRSWLMRIVFYWTVLTLGAVLFFAAVTALGAGAFVNVFMKHLPLGSELLRMLGLLLPSFSIAVLILILTLFYRFIPNTHVFWRAAFIGAFVVAALLVLNNYLAFFYFRRVLINKSLYGSLGILPILMFGLYIFWWFVLLGGQISYAVQNVHFRSSRAAWNSLAEATRERLSLIVLLTICRRFQECLPPVTASQLGALIKVPTQILNECLNRLVDLKFVTPIPPSEGDTPTDYLYQPARPLAHLTLQDFKQAFDNYGDDPTGDALEGLDPLAMAYREHMAVLGRDGFFTKPLDRLLADFPFDETRPPFSRMAAG